MADREADPLAALAQEALGIVSGPRRAAYGPPERNFAAIAAFWTVYLRATGRDVEVRPQDIPAMMRLLKEARLCATPGHRDGLVDVIGYALLQAELTGEGSADG